MPKRIGSQGNDKRAKEFVETAFGLILSAFHFLERAFYRASVRSYYGNRGILGEEKAFRMGGLSGKRLNFAVVLIGIS